MGDLVGSSAPRIRLANLAVVLALLACSEPRVPANVLLVVVDTARADAVGATGSASTNHTPNLDRLARDGVVFTQARTVSAWTLPAHASLFTGLFPSRHGAHWENLQLDDSHRTLAELLAPTHQSAGFSENPHIIRELGFAQGFDHFRETWRRNETGRLRAPTLSAIEMWLGVRDRTRPFFLFVNLMDPHLPYRPSPAWRKRLLPSDLAPARVERMLGIGEREARRVITGSLTLDDADLEVLRALYRIDVAVADGRVGDVLELLERAKELEHTLVVVVGDHGENIGDHGLMEHQLSLHESVLRVPLILRLRGVFEGGRKLDAPVQLVDVAPTILDVVGVPRAQWPPFQGRSLLSEDLSSPRPIVAEYMRPTAQRPLFERVDPNFDFTPFDQRLHSIQLGTLKLIAGERRPPELYDLADDPDEYHDLAAARPADVTRLEDAFTRWLDGAVFPSPGRPIELDPKTLEALRELGYVE